MIPATSASAVTTATQLVITTNTCGSYLTTGATCTLVATLEDASDNPVIDGTAVTFANGGVGTVTGLSSVTNNGDGTYSVTVTASADGAVSITATDTVDGPLTTSPAVTFTVQGTVTQLVITSNNCGSHLNAGATCTVIATLEDASDNPVVDGSTVTFVQGGSDVGVVTGLPSVTNNGDGTYGVTVTARTNGAVSITAADSSDAITTSSPVVNFTVQGGSVNTAIPTTFAVGVQNTNPYSNFYSVACPSDGNCVAVGEFRDFAGNYESFRATETNGAWGNGVPTTFAVGVQSTSPSDYFNSVACPSNGNCVAVGEFYDAAGHYESFTATETNGAWGDGVPTTFAVGVQSTSPSDYFNSVACSSNGNCAAVGNFRDAAGHYESFTATETNGVWGDGVPTTFAVGVQYTSPNSYFYSVACPSNGNCVAVGDFRDAAGHYESFTATETNGVWGDGVPTTFAVGVQNTSPDDYLYSVACPSNGNCVAVGEFRDANGNYESFTATETNGVWGDGVPTTFAVGVQNTSPDSYFYSVACPSNGNCVAVGEFRDFAGNYESFTATETNGVWGDGVPTTFAVGVQSTSPYSYFYSVACPSNGNCVAVGKFRDAAGNSESFTATETNGVWGDGVPTTFAVGVQNTSPQDYLYSVACPSNGNCVAVGEFLDANGNYEAMTLGVAVTFAPPPPPPPTHPLAQSALSVTSTSGTVGAALTLATSGGSGTGALSFSVVAGTASGCAISSGTLLATSAGTCVVTATKAADATYGAVSSTATTVTFAPAPLIAQSALSVTSTSGTVGAALTLATSGGSGTGALSFSVVAGTASGCAISSGTLSVTSAGTCVVTATKAADTDYLVASSAATTVTFARNAPAGPKFSSISGRPALIGKTVTFTIHGSGFADVTVKSSNAHTTLHMVSRTGTLLKFTVTVSNQQKHTGLAELVIANQYGKFVLWYSMKWTR